MAQVRNILADVKKIDTIETNVGQLQTEVTNFDALPSQTGQIGKYLTTDGSVASWNTITQYTPPTNQGSSNFLSGDGTYKAVTVPTAVSQLTNDSNYQTASQVSTAVAGLVNSAPAVLDTLNELATALGDDPNFATTISGQIAAKWTQDNIKISNWDIAYSWGNHANFNYATLDNVNQGLASRAQLSGATFTGPISATSFSGNGAGLTHLDWTQISNTPSSISRRATYVANAGDTVFAVQYTAGSVEVYLNGMHLMSGTDYTATNGTSITLTDPANAGDEIEIIGFSTFSIANVYTQAETSALIASSITSKWTQDNTKISNWDTAYSWGNHASAGYLTSTYASVVNITDTTSAIQTSVGGALKVAGGSYLGYGSDKAYATFFGRGLASGMPYVAANWNGSNNTASDGYLTAWYIKTQAALYTPGATLNNTNNTFSTPVVVTDTTASTSKTTGSLKVTGGAGISGDVYATSFHGDGSGLTNIPSDATKADQATTYTKTEVNTALGLKADQSTTYTKTEVNNSLALKTDLTTYNSFVSSTNSSISTINAGLANANFPGCSPLRAANSAVEIFDAGIRGKGFFWLNSPNGGKVLNFCDLDTLDQDGKAGWILVAMFPMAQNWRDDGLSTRMTLNPYDIMMNQNDGTPQPDRKLWSANWGDYQMNRFRIQNAWSVNEAGPNATMDWYFNYTNACAWKQVWNFQAGTGNYINDTSGDNNGNINAAYCSGYPAPTNQAGTVSRCCLRGFKSAYNLRYGYSVDQRWNNLSDSSGGGTAQNTSYNWWAGLTQPHYTLGWGVGSDGSLAILPQGSTYTAAGQDCDVQNFKVGIDDASAATMWASSATGTTSQTGLTDTYRSLFFWIK